MHKFFRSLFTVLTLLVAAGVSPAVEPGVSPSGIVTCTHSPSSGYLVEDRSLSMSGETRSQGRIWPILTSSGIYPGGILDNSIAFQRRFGSQKKPQVPEGRQNGFGVRSSLRDLVEIVDPFPSVETLAYYPRSLRDAAHMEVAWGPAGSATGCDDIPTQSGAGPGGKMPPSTAGETPAATNLVIGLLLPETEPLGLSIRQGALLGIESLSNSTEKMCATLVIRGAVGQWGTDGVEAARMVSDDGALGLIAPPDGAGSHLALQVAGRTAVPVISLCGDSSVTQTGVPWTVRIVPRTGEEAKAIFWGCKSKARRWVACVPDGRRGRQITHDIAEAAAAAGISLQKPIPVRWPMTSPSLFCDRLLDNRPEGILLWLDPIPAASLLKLLRTAGFEGQLVGPSWLRCRELENRAGSAMEGFVMPSPALDKETNARFERFANAFRARFGREPDATAAMSYDATQLLVQILYRANGRPAHEFFPVDQVFPGVTGVLSFDAQGNRKLKLELREGRNGYLLCTAQDAQAKRWGQ